MCTTGEPTVSCSTPSNAVHNTLHDDVEAHGIEGIIVLLHGHKGHQGLDVHLVFLEIQATVADGTDAPGNCLLSNSREAYCFLLPHPCGQSASHLVWVAVLSASQLEHIPLRKADRLALGEVESQAGLLLVVSEGRLTSEIGAFLLQILPRHCNCLHSLVERGGAFAQHRWRFSRPSVMCDFACHLLGAAFPAHLDELPGCDALVNQLLVLIFFPVPSSVRSWLPAVSPAACVATCRGLAYSTVLTFDLHIL
mmetsp:Transcript_15593/g.47056  ORF Transcript_15593/g.47056 Transcript_15593/m.47056 type:complete len:252 (+) Transcript_15593:291-1046(+)